MSQVEALLARLHSLSEAGWRDWVNDIGDDAQEYGFKHQRVHTHDDGAKTHVYQHPQTGHTLYLSASSHMPSWAMTDKKGTVIDRSNSDWHPHDMFLDRAAQKAGLKHSYQKGSLNKVASYESELPTHHACNLCGWKGAMKIGRYYCPSCDQKSLVFTDHTGREVDHADAVTSVNKYGGSYGPGRYPRDGALRGKMEDLDYAILLVANGRNPVRVLESVMTTIHHDFYGNRAGINNRIPVCPSCGMHVEGVGHACRRVGESMVESREDEYASVMHKHGYKEFVPGSGSGIYLHPDNHAVSFEGHAWKHLDGSKPTRKPGYKYALRNQTGEGTSPASLDDHLTKFHGRGSVGESDDTRKDHPWHNATIKRGYVHTGSEKATYPGVGLGMTAFVHRYRHDDGPDIMLAKTASGRPFAKVGHKRFDDGAEFTKHVSSIVPQY